MPRPRRARRRSKPASPADRPVLHELLEWQRAALSALARRPRPRAPAHAAGTAAASLPRAPRPHARRRRGQRPHAWPRRCRPTRRFPVRAETVASDALRAAGAAARASRTQRRRYLLMAPHSGYATAVLSPLATLLAGGGEVLVTDWIDARLVPAAAGRFRAGRAGGARARPRPPSWRPIPPRRALAGRAGGTRGRGPPASRPGRARRCAASPSSAASSTRRGPVAAAAGAGAAGRASCWQRSSPPRCARATPGAGRRVYPAVLQLLAYSLVSPGLYAEVQGGLWRELAAGRRPARYGRQHADLHSLADVPAELFLDMLAWVLGRGPWGRPSRSSPASPSTWRRLRRLPVLTLESGEDELIGPARPMRSPGRLGLDGGASGHAAACPPPRPVHRPGLSRPHGARAAPLPRRAVDG